jgi:hypothetical protein
VTPRRVVWVVERDGATYEMRLTKREADSERSLLEKFCLDGSKFTVTRYEPAKPKRKGGGVVDR